MLLGVGISIGIVVGLFVAAVGSMIWLAWYLTRNGGFWR